MKNVDNWTVYIHIVPMEISGYDHDKYYVGITSRDVKKRWGHNGGNYKNNPYIFQAIKKYGWDNMYHEIFASNITEKEAKKMETTLIGLLNSNNSEYGYNLTRGGDGLLGYHHSEESKRKIGLACLGNQHAKGKLLGNKNALGNHLSEETREKMGQSKKGNTNNGIAFIKCIETNEIKRTCEWIQAGFQNAYQVAKGRQKTCSGYHFVYVQKGGFK